jgi:hypothetical protein
VTFVVAPRVPGRLNAALFQDAAKREMAREMAADGITERISGAVPAGGRTVVPAMDGAAVQPAVLQELLERANAGATRDRDFIESWYAQQSRPTQVRAVSGERILAIRQFELANGERVAVLTDLGAAVDRPAADRPVERAETGATGQLF